MKERPILMSAPMVRAILDGSKTQTRRIVKGDALGILNLEIRPHTDPIFSRKCPYGLPGDRLWVKETWAARPDQDNLPPSMCDDTGIWWRASMSAAPTRYEACHGKWRPSIFMPRWASRITLEITGIRVERLQDISEADARAEGITEKGVVDDIAFCNPLRPIVDHPTARNAFFALWASLNGAESLAANPWVGVAEFKRVDK